MKIHRIEYDLKSKRELMEDCRKLAVRCAALENEFNERLGRIRAITSGLCDAWWVRWIPASGRVVLKALDAEVHAK